MYFTFDEIEKMNLMGVNIGYIDLVELLTDFDSNKFILKNKEGLLIFPTFGELDAVANINLLKNKYCIPKTPFEKQMLEHLRNYEIALDINEQVWRRGELYGSTSVIAVGKPQSRLLEIIEDIKYFPI